MKKGLGIILHSGSFDRLSHGLNIALAALALGREVRLFFSWWALERIKKKSAAESLTLDEEARQHKAILEKNLKEGHIQGLLGLVKQVKEMGGSIYACTSSMGILNIARDELIEEVDMSMGITTFLTEVQEHQLIFV